MTDPTPEHLELARCELCSQTSSHITVEHLAQLIAEAEARGAARAQRWIPVEEALPEIPGLYNVATDCGEVEFSVWTGSYWGWVGVNITHFGVNITHWQPLPEPPAPQ